MTITPATLAAFIPMILGGIFSFFKPFLESEKEFRNRCTLMLAHRSEEIANALSRLIYLTVKTKYLDDTPRGDGFRTEDPYAEVANLISKNSKLNFRVSARLLYFRFFNFLILIGLVGGIAVPTRSFSGRALSLS